MGSKHFNIFAPPLEIVSRICLCVCGRHSGLEYDVEAVKVAWATISTTPPSPNDANQSLTCLQAATFRFQKQNMQHNNKFENVCIRKAAKPLAASRA